MITALVSSAIGALSGAIPEMIKEFRDQRDHVREKEFMLLNAELQIKLAEAKLSGELREIEANVYVEEAKAWKEYMGDLIQNQMTPTGIRWIDAFNSVLRPLVALMIIFLFMATAVPYVWGVYSSYLAGVIDAQTFALVIWGSLVGESIQAVLGFLFGYRSTRKIANT